jgi:hypothetical protein
MAQSAAYNTTLKVGDTPTTLANAACTRITANTVYRITDATKRVLDPATAVVVESDPLANGTWGAIAATVDYFTGTVTVADQGGTALVRVSGKYIPLANVLYAKAASFTQAADSLDITDFESAGWREFLVGLQRGDLSFEVVAAAAENLGPGTLRDALGGRGEVFVEYQPGGQGYWYRFWALLDSRATNAPIDGLVGSTLTAVMTTYDPAAGFSLSAVGTT